MDKMKGNYTQFPRRFVSYQTNRITCDFENEENFQDAMSELEIEGFDSSKFYILEGAEGIKALDPEGVEHGFSCIVSRFLHRFFSEAEERSIKDMVQDLENGMIHVAVLVHGKAERDKVHRIMDQFQGQKISYFGLFHVESYERAS